MDGIIVGQMAEVESVGLQSPSSFPHANGDDPETVKDAP